MYKLSTVRKAVLIAITSDFLDIVHILCSSLLIVLCPPLERNGREKNRKRAEKNGKKRKVIEEKKRKKVKMLKYCESK